MSSNAPMPDQGIHLESLVDFHARNVAAIAGDLFDVFAVLHGFGPDEAKLLVLASLLHDIGWCGGRQGHHRRSMEMIYTSPPAGLSPRCAAIVANVARYHRKALPSIDHERYAALRPADREIVRRLSAIIRIADGLDRTHQGVARVVGCHISASEVIIKLDCSSDCSAEIAEAQEKADLFTEVFGRGISFEIVGIHS